MYDGARGGAIRVVANLMPTLATKEGLDIDVVSYPDVLLDRDFIPANRSRSYTDGFGVGGPS